MMKIYDPKRIRELGKLLNTVVKDQVLELSTPGFQSLLSLHITTSFLIRKIGLMVSTSGDV